MSTGFSHAPTAIAPAVISKILYLRQQYHFVAWPDCGLLEALSPADRGRVVGAPHLGAP